MCKEEKEAWPPSMSDEELIKFVDGFISGKIFTSNHVLESNRGCGVEAKSNVMRMVFMPLAFGALSKVSEGDLKKIALFWEWIDQAGPRSINGMPVFMSCRCMGHEDWKRACVAIEKEMERRRNIEV